jgi:HSP20 family molecular chaperone IbpA
MSESKFTIVKKKHNNYEKLENDVKILQRQIYSPKVDLISSDDSFKVRIELPGVQKDTIKVQLKEQQIILISGVRNSLLMSDLSETDKIIYSETKYGNFIRRVKLPEIVEQFYFNINNSELVDGVLYLQFKKKGKVIVNPYLNENVNWSDLV